jgi:NO-binding membrane sensor protein with MHYT domain
MDFSWIRETTGKSSVVALAGAVCFLAGAVAVSLFERARASRGRSRCVWIMLDAAVAGDGIWSAHGSEPPTVFPGTTAREIR